MNSCKHLKNKKVLVQFSDGSSLYLNCYINKKEAFIESDIKLNSFWKYDFNSVESNNLKSHLFNDYKKLFIKHK